MDDGSADQQQQASSSGAEAEPVNASTHEGDADAYDNDGFEEEDQQQQDGAADAVGAGEAAAGDDEEAGSRGENDPAANEASSSGPTTGVLDRAPSSTAYNQAASSIHGDAPASSGSPGGLPPRPPGSGSPPNGYTSTSHHAGGRSSRAGSAGSGTGRPSSSSLQQQQQHNDSTDPFVRVHSHTRGSSARTGSAGAQSTGLDGTVVSDGQQHADDAAEEGPSHLRSTTVQPKPPLQDAQTIAASEHLRTVWSTGNCLGIRSLPDALSPDFRQRLYEELLEARRRERAGVASGRRHHAELAYGLEGGPLGMPLSIGQKQVARVHPLSGLFTQFEYLPSEYERGKLMGKFERLKHKLSQVAPSDFVVKAPPQGPKGAPAFSEFAYEHDAYDSALQSRRADEEVSRAKIINGPFYPSGTIQRPTFLKGRLDECMMALCRTLSDDWPTGFLQIFEDKSGGIVMSFDKNRAVAEGDLSSYMNQLSKVNNHVLSYGLTKDSTQWGMVDEDTQSVFFVFWAPWVRHKYLGSSATQPLNSQRRSAEQPGGSDDEDNEDGGGNDGGGQPASSLPTGGGGVLGSGPGVGGTGGGMYGSAASGPGMLGSARPNPIRAR